MTDAADTPASLEWSDTPPAGSRLPDFFIVGAARSGTSSLHSYLAQHPQIYMSAVKEPTFFVVAHRRGEHLPAGTPFGDALVYAWSEYVRLFAGASTDEMAGESSVWYLHSTEAAEAISQRVPRARIIAILRQPVSRAYSHFRFYRSLGLEPLRRFDDAVAAQAERRALGWPVHFQYTEWSLYSAAIERYIRLFGSDRVRVYPYDRMQHDAEGLVHDILEFLGVDSGIRVDVRARLNRSPEERSPAWRRQDSGVSPRLMTELNQMFEPDIERVRLLTGIDLSSSAR